MPKLPPNEVFERYEEEIVTDPAYAGMPDLYKADGGIQWEAPSNRGAGQFQFTHDKRLAWWKKKAEEVEISTSEDKWISKVAMLIHPTKQKPCKCCGRIMDIRYCYLSSILIKRIMKLPYVTDELEVDYCTNILDLVVEFESLYGEERLNDLGCCLKCKAVPSIPFFDSTEDFIEWLSDFYIPSEPSLLSPGAMSNAPDRLDGFHTYNRCCRSTADKGRSKSNLASYSTDRRAFEYWVDGNWVEANMAMGLFRSDAEVQQIPCMNDDGQTYHPLPCAADHIGPISLGFSHRPVFQPLCTPCNSAKNNRMYYSDVQKLIAAEQDEEDIASWYCAPVWNRLKNLVETPDDAVKLSRVLRDNRHNAMMLLERLMLDGHLVFLTTFLNLLYANYEYDISDWWMDDKSTVYVNFSVRPSTLEYSRIKKARRIRVAFQALSTYAQKENRNGLLVEFAGANALYAEIERAASAFESPHYYQDLNEALAEELSEDFSDAETLKNIADGLPCSDVFEGDRQYQAAKHAIDAYMDGVGKCLASMWDDPRYTRTDYDDMF